MLSVLLPIFGRIIEGVAGKLFPNPGDELKRLELQNQIQVEMIKRAAEIETAAIDVVKAEIQGGSTLQRVWRPITMLTFVTLIVARWLGWSAPGLSEAEVLKLWDIVQLGLGGYVIGRTAEKVIPSLMNGKKG